MPAALAFATTSFADMVAGSDRMKAAFECVLVAVVVLGLAIVLLLAFSLVAFEPRRTLYTSWVENVTPAAFPFATTSEAEREGGSLRMKSDLFGVFSERLPMGAYYQVL